MSSDSGNGFADGKSRRRCVRTKLRAAVKISHPEVGDLKLHTADISDGGAYIFSEGNSVPAVGEIVNVQLQGIGDGEAPIVKMKIVRLDNSGMGLEFLSPDAQGE